MKYKPSESHAVAWRIFGIMETANLIAVLEHDDVKNAIAAKVKYEISTHFEHLAKIDQNLIISKANLVGIELGNGFIFG